MLISWEHENRRGKTAACVLAGDRLIIRRSIVRKDAKAILVTLTRNLSGQKKSLSRRMDVKPAPFAYAKARSLDEAISLLSEHRSEARLLSGGQSLLPTLNMRLSAPRMLIDINGIPGLDQIDCRDGTIKIGAMLRYAQAEQAPEISQYAPLIARALPEIAHPAIRNRGTIGGSIALADPAAELPACLLALDGQVELVGPKGERVVAAENFFKGLFETAIAPDEVLTAIRFPAATTKSRYGFAEFSRRHGDYALVGLAASARAESGALADLRLVYFGVSTKPVRACNAEVALARGDLNSAVNALASDLKPPDDVQAKGAFKKHLAGVLLKRVARQLDEESS